MIKYKSTRGHRHLYRFSEVILKGMADDGGLFIPNRLPIFSKLKLISLANKSYPKLFENIIAQFRTDFSEESIKKIVTKAYTDNFDNKVIVPVKKLKDNRFLIELWHGPTSAFKDLALQIMPWFFQEALQQENKNRLCDKKKPINYFILVATSGDTGKAALEGFKNKKGINIIVFYPYNGVSLLQKLSMSTQEGKNLAVYGTDNDFDTTQTYVKYIFNDIKFNELLLNKHNTVLSSANSINWGRILPQIIYHIFGYLQLVRNQVIKTGQQIDIAVPTGNFGNILAAFYAKKMGLPIKKLICASNENNVVTEFLRTGIYNLINRKQIKTPSPSMDILLASNIERLLYEITQDCQKVSFWMNTLNQKNIFKVDINTKQILQEIFYADYVSNRVCLDTIKETFQEANYLIDPHTAVAMAVVNRYKESFSYKRPVIVCSTAHWSKFAGDVYNALKETDNDNLIDEFKIINNIKHLAPGSEIPDWIFQLKQKKIRFPKQYSVNMRKIKEIILSEINNNIS